MRLTTLQISIFLFGLMLLNAPCDSFGQNKNFTVVIDPGHGGRDPGAIGFGTREKDIVLAVGQKLGDLIKANYQDVNVVYTRSTDKFIDLNVRAEIANKAKANLFISLHCNALDKNKVSPRGVETYVLGLHRSKDNLNVAKAENAVILYEQDYSTKYQGFDPNEPESYIMFEFMTDQYLNQSINFASLVQNRLVNNAKRVNRNVRQAGFLVLRDVAMPSVLVEIGYITNAEDHKYMKSASGQNAIANAVYLAFKDYKYNYDKKNNLMTNGSSAQQTVSQGKSTYKVQFLTASRKLSTHAAQLKGLSPVDYYVDGTTYKYTYGDTENMNEIRKVLAEVQKKFKDAFIIEFKDGKRVR